MFSVVLDGPAGWKVIYITSGTILARFALNVNSAKCTNLW